MWYNFIDLFSGGTRLPGIIRTREWIKVVVLLSLVWFIKDGKRFTQLSALRTDSAWNTVDAFNAVIDPGEGFRDPSINVYLGGIAPETYKRGMTVKACIRQFEDWLTPEDEIWVWNILIRRSLADLWKRYSLRLQPRVRVLYHPSCTNLPENPHAILSARGKEAPLPQHRAQNDVEALRRVLPLSEVQNMLLLTLDTFTLQLAPPPREWNLAWAQRTDFNFVYLKTSPVFHRRDCPLWSRTENREALVGCSTYKSAAKERRPCRFCKPEPLPEPAPEPIDLRQFNREWVLSTNYNYIYLKNSPVFHRTDCPLWTAAKNRTEVFGSITYETAAKTRRPCRCCKPMPQIALIPEPEAPKQKKKKAAPAPNPESLLSVHMVSGENLSIKVVNIVGWCHYKLHRGCLNQSLYVSHDCSGKQCVFFEANPCSSYLKNLNKKKTKKTQVNMQRKREKEAQIREENRMIALKKLWQKHADSLKLKIMLVRVVQEGDNAYRVLYVSKNNCPDEDLYGNLIKKARLANPALQITLRHVRDVDGHCVTINEFLKRRPA